MTIRDLDNLQALMGNPQDPELIQKALTVGTGFVGINLEPAAKLMLPLYAGLRNRVAVDRPRMGGTQAIWRMQIGYGSFNFGSNMGTAFGAVGPDVTDNTVSVSADYKTQAIRGSVQYEAIPMAQGFDDPLAIETARTLSTLLRLEELQVLGGNAAAITMGAVTGTASTAAALNTFAAGTWTVKVTALTLQGTLTNAAANSNVGESAVATVAITVGVGGCDWLDIHWAAVPGALGYKVYCESAEAAGDSKLVNPNLGLAYPTATPLATLGDAIVVPTGQTYVTVTHVQIYTPPLATQPDAPAGDATANANMNEGLMSWASKSTVYGQAVGSKIAYDCQGLPLTTAGSGVSEFDYILSNLWSQWVISPTLIITSPTGAASLTDKLIAANNAAMYRLEIAQERGQFIGGVFVGGYLNKFAASLMGNQPATIPVWAHPYMPDGTFMFLSERIPYQYSQEARGFALDVQTPYTYFELARTDRSFPFSTFYTEVLKCYHPLAQCVIQGARVK